MLIDRIEKEVLGLNRRNQEYVRQYNPLASRAIADNKLLTKRVLGKALIKTPEVYKVIRTKKQLEYLDWESLPKSFVLKPNQGTGGNGIVVFYGRKKGKLEWIRPSGETMDQRDILLHIESILEGRFSMGNRNDIAIIEERVKIDNVLKPYVYKGVPDVRIIVFNRVPVMAMTRLPTKRSNGTANLHSGAICVGLDMASGVTTTAMHLKKQPLIEDTYELTDTTLDLEKNQSLSGLKIPFWNEILEIAIKCQDVSGLGYLGVDIALDREKGPVVFEINARPGLGIQVANRVGLRGRLERVKGLKIKSVKHGIRVAKNLFGGQVEEEIEQISGKNVVNLVEKILVYHKDLGKLTKRKKPKEREKDIVKAMLDTGILTSRIDKGLCARIGYTDAIKHFKAMESPKRFETLTDAQDWIDRNSEIARKHPDILRLAKIVDDGNIIVTPVLEIDIKISGENKKVDMILSSQTSTIFPVLLGRKELQGYLIDTSKTFTR